VAGEVDEGEEVGQLVRGEAGSVQAADDGADAGADDHVDRDAPRDQLLDDADVRGATRGAPAQDQGHLRSPVRRGGGLRACGKERQGHTQCDRHGGHEHARAMVRHRVLLR
jgi:hypothetical protein